ncbi:hypothetical protein vseg_005619 [Gypsophila vaccaria]
MVSRENKRASSLHEKLQLLRSITHSHAENDTSIILDASKYIEELKEKVERLNQDIVGGTQSSINQETMPSVTVETLEKGFLINVYSEKSCPGLLVSILEAFEDLHLSLVQATASCVQKFHLEAFSVEFDSDQDGGTVDAEVVRQAVLQAIRNQVPT